jgi:hypothetical protein
MSSFGSSGIPPLSASSTNSNPPSRPSSTFPVQVKPHAFELMRVLLVIASCLIENKSDILTPVLLCVIIE